MAWPPPTVDPKQCNFRTPQNCKLYVQCLTENVIYECNVKSAESTKSYVGLTATSFKTRYTAHKASFTYQSKAHNTALSAYTWELKHKNTPYTHNWSILKVAPSYSRTVRSCQLCLTEKTIISTMDKKSSLNKRNEIISKCRHRDKLLPETLVDFFKTKPAELSTNFFLPLPLNMTLST